MSYNNFTTESTNLHYPTVDSKPRNVQILTDPPDSAEWLVGWGFWLAEAATYAPWSREASIWVDRAIALREGGAAW